MIRSQAKVLSILEPVKPNKFVIPRYDDEMV